MYTKELFENKFTIYDHWKKNEINRTQKTQLLSMILWKALETRILSKSFQQHSLNPLQRMSQKPQTWMGGNAEETAARNSSRSCSNSGCRWKHWASFQLSAHTVHMVTRWCLELEYLRVKRYSPQQGSWPQYWVCPGHWHLGHLSTRVPLLSSFPCYSCLFGLSDHPIGSFATPGWAHFSGPLTFTWSLNTGLAPYPLPLLW